MNYIKNEHWKLIWSIEWFMWNAISWPPHDQLTVFQSMAIVTYCRVGMRSVNVNSQNGPFVTIHAVVINHYMDKDVNRNWTIDFS